MERPKVEYVDAVEAAECLGLTPRIFSMLVRRGLLPLKRDHISADGRDMFTLPALMAVADHRSIAHYKRRLLEGYM